MRASRQLPRAVVMMLMALPYAMCAPEASAFDGHRKGFTIGFVVGASRVDRNGDEPSRHYWSVSDPTSDSTVFVVYDYVPPANPATGLASQFKLGFGFSESVRLCYTAQTDFEGSSSIGISDGGTSDGADVEGGSGTLTVDYYPGGARGKWFGSAGAGVGRIGNLLGPAYHVSVGWDFWHGAQVQLTASRYGTTTRHNHAARILMGWMWN